MLLDRAIRPSPIVLAALLLAAGASAQRASPLNSLYSECAPATAFATGDFDSDGVPDACLGQVDGWVSIQSGLGDGRFAPLPGVDTGHPGYLTDVAPADVDADGALDVLALVYAYGTTQQSELLVLLGAGDGTLQISAHVPLAPGTQTLATADLQNDGLTDAVAVDPVSATLTVFLNQGGALQAAGSLPCHSYEVALGDLSGDGWPDLAVGDSGLSVKVLAGDGQGGFVPAAHVSAGAYPVMLALADTNGDGEPDIVVSSPSSSAVLQNGPHLTFEPAEPTPLGLIPSAGDLDEDGDAELVSISYDHVDIAGSTGGRDYTLVNRLGIPGSSWGLVVEDLNVDGDLDLLAGPSGSFSAASGVLTASLGFGDGSFVGATRPLDGHANGGGFGDVDGDGIGDAVVAGSDGSFDVSLNLFRGLGQARFQPGSWIPTLDDSSTTVLADVDGDDDLDVLVDGYWQVVLHRGDGRGGLGAGELLLDCGHPWQLRVTDFDADGDTDAGCLCPADFRVKSLMNDGHGDFTSKTAFQCGTSSGLCFADFGGDSFPDAVVPNDFGLPLSLDYRRGLGDGKFEAHAEFTGLGPLLDAEAGDIDTDGDLDLLTIAKSSQSVLVMLNDGTGNLAASTPQWPAGTGDARDLVLCDFSLDGLLDIAVSDFAPDTPGVRYLAGEPGAAFALALNAGPMSSLLEIADVDADGAIDLQLLGPADVALNHLGPWEDLGNALAGGQGKPRQVGHGTAQPGTIVAVALHDGARLSLAVQFIGFAEGSVPFKGGVLVPTPDLVNSPLLTDAQGDLLLGGVWPASFVAGDALVLQTWIRDDAAPALWSASNALRVTTP